MFRLRNLILPFLIVFILASCKAAPNGEGLLSAHFIDVGQGDSTLIILPTGETALIDAGSARHGDTVVNYIKNEGITKIDYLIATHPHEDHIGGMPLVIESFGISEVYMPNAVTTTNAYLNLLDAIENAGLFITTAEAGVVFFENGGASLEFISPASKYPDLNNMSAVVLAVYGDARFLFLGDAEHPAIDDMLKPPHKLRADALKAGHHGSATSTSAELLAAVLPNIAIISCGAGNTYGHPANETLTLLETVPYTYRTDIDGTVIITTDGKQIEIKSGLPYMRSSALYNNSIFSASLYPSAFSIPELTSIA